MTAQVLANPRLPGSQNELEDFWENSHLMEVGERGHAFEGLVPAAGERPDTMVR